MCFWIFHLSSSSRWLLCNWKKERVALFGDQIWLAVDPTMIVMLILNDVDPLRYFARILTGQSWLVLGALIFHQSDLPFKVNAYTAGCFAAFYLRSSSILTQKSTTFILWPHHLDDIPFLTVNCNSITAQVESWRWGEFSPQGSFDLFIGPMCTWGPIIGSPCPSLRTSKTFLKPCEDLVKTVNVVNVVKI